MRKKSTIISKTAQIGSFTLLSRCLGIIREMLLVRFIGADALSDAFFTAYKIPNSLRKVFAEGALSAAFVPTLVQMIKQKGKEHVYGLLTLAFFVFEGMVALLCAFVMCNAHTVIAIIAPGFSVEQTIAAVSMVSILMPFIFFISISALFAGALHAVGKFTIPAIAPALLNVVIITGLSVCLWLQLSVYWLCWTILFGGALICALHVYAYLRAGFAFTKIKKEDVTAFMPVMKKFLLCLPSVSVLELSLFIDTSFASLLEEGSISLLYYANRFMGIPLGIFSVALATVLLPHFSRVKLRAPKRLHFYLLESAKLIFWVTIPIALIMGYFAEDIFYTIFLSEKFSIEQVVSAAHILRAFLCGLFFFSLNKILLSIYYALDNTWIPAVIAAIAGIVNIVCDYYFIDYFQAFGLALATSISGIVQTMLFIVILHQYFHFRIFIKHFFDFFVRYLFQLLCCTSLFMLIYKTIEHSIINFTSTWLFYILLHTVVLWLWVGPLVLAFFIVLFTTKNIIGLRLHFLER